MKDVKCRGLCLLVLVLILLPSLSKSEEKLFEGSLSTRYKFRAIGDFKDHDIENLLSLDVGNGRRFSGSLLAGALTDLDRTSTGSPFRSAPDALNTRAVGRLYHAYLDIHEAGPLQKMRAGRQHRYEFESLYYDGATLETKSFHHLTLTAFGGVPVHQFENQIGFDPGDWLVGSALDYTPLSNFQVRFDFVHLRDKVSGFRTLTGNRDDNLFGGTVWWDIDKHVGMNARFTSFSDQVRDVSSRLSVRIPEKDLLLEANYFQLLKGYDIRVIELDAFGVAGAYQPYIEMGFRTSKGIGPHFSIDGGYSSRLLTKTQVASAFNHGFQRVFASISSYDLPVTDLVLTATGDYYHGDDNTLKNNIFAGSFVAAQKFFNKRLQLTGGTLFYLYRYNLFAGNESTDVRTFFGQIRGKIRKDLEARLGYEFENNSVDNFHQVDTRLVWSF